MPSAWGGTGLWTFGPSRCFQEADGQVYFNDNGDTKSDASVFLVCQMLECEGDLRLSGSELSHPEPMGLYTKTASATGDRPIYKSESGQFYIFYGQEFDAWRIGHSYSSTWALFASMDGDSPPCPNHVAAWYAFNGTVFQPVPDVTLLAQAAPTSEPTAAPTAAPTASPTAAPTSPTEVVPAPPTPFPSTTYVFCNDMDDGALDSHGDDCLWWAANAELCQYSFIYDDGDFSATDMCCACKDIPDCSESIDGGGWVLVRHTAGSGNWGPFTDGLMGTDVLEVGNGAAAGTALDSQHWTLQWDTHSVDQFLFATADCQKWLIASRGAVGGSITGEYYYNGTRTINRSSSSNTSYSAAWHNREGFQQDPWISLGDVPQGVLYAEDSSDLHVADKNAHFGTNVYVRSGSSIAHYNGYYEVWSDLVLQTGQTLIIFADGTAMVPNIFTDSLRFDAGVQLYCSHDADATMYIIHGG
ncbi:unnamed protein product [Prorocentrum cordatum]|uniref:Fibrinogen C-terminal domain-containing protein n=1 Tax=Prorocentrum cordatum TaxID=2364126 RepID=A0ABN9T4E4_9DINO|nr:unnamed protein product [Polarella glacialis]